MKLNLSKNRLVYIKHDATTLPLSGSVFEQCNFEMLFLSLCVLVFTYLRHCKLCLISVVYTPHQYSVFVHKFSRLERKTIIYKFAYKYCVSFTPYTILSRDLYGILFVSCKYLFIFFISSRSTKNNQIRK